MQTDRGSFDKEDYTATPGPAEVSGRDSFAFDVPLPEVTMPAHSPNPLGEYSGRGGKRRQGSDSQAARKRTTGDFSNVKLTNFCSG